MSSPRAVIAHLGREGAMGEVRRVRSWRQVLAAADIDAVPLPVVGGRPAASRVLRSAGAVARGAMVPEALAWSPDEVATRLAAKRPELLICITARAYHPDLRRSAPAVVLDFVDRLSVSYGDRAGLATSRARALGYGLLARRHRRFESRGVDSVHRVAAGWADARELGADWLPNVADECALPAVATNPDVDVLFVGTLHYPPNEEAVERLGSIWPEVLRRRPGTTALVAGAKPSATVRRVCERHGWLLVSDFDCAEPLYARSRLAVAPLMHTAGIQNKVIDAAAFGVAQVVSPAARTGLDPAFPVTVAADDHSFATAIVDLLDDPLRRNRERDEARRHVAERYTAAAWADWARGLVARP